MDFLRGIAMESETGLFVIFPSLCKGCGLCVQKCPMKALRWSDVLGVYDLPVAEIDTGKCVSCGVCQEFCPDCAILVVRKGKGDCMACATCESVCANGAIYVRDALEYSLNEGKCQRCGDCFRACPTGAMSRRGFSAPIQGSVGQAQILFD